MTSQVSYVNYDFDDLLVQLQARVQNKAAWKDMYRSGSGEMLLELIAYCLNAGLFYTERTFQEQQWPLAKNKSSIVNMASILNYSPKRNTSALGTLQFSTTTSTTTKIIYIPQYTECQTSAGIKYLTNAPSAIQKGSSSVSVGGIQGSLVTVEIASTGLASQQYTINDTLIENSADTDNPTLNIYVDSELWTKVTSFVDSDPTSKHYRIISNIDGTIAVLFGDNINGKIPDGGDVISIRYIQSAGLSGNLSTTGLITTINDVVYDEDGTATTVNVTNSTAFLGGDDAETGEEIQTEAPQVFKTGDRAVTKSDFQALIMNYPGVADCNVWGENEIIALSGDAADVTALNTVYISIILQEWLTPDAAFKSTLSEDIYEKSMQTVLYYFQDLTILNVVPVLWVKVPKGYSLSQAQADIEDALAGQFELGTTTKLGEVVKYSNILAALNDLETVSYVTMNLEIEQSLSLVGGVGPGWVTFLSAIPIKKNTCRLFIDNTYVTTDADGYFTSAGGYTISGGFIDSTGSIGVSVSPTASSVYVRYQQDDDADAGNITPSFDQIAKLDSVDIQSITIED